MNDLSWVSMNIKGSEAKYNRDNDEDFLRWRPGHRHQRVSLQELGRMLIVFSTGRVSKEVR